MKIVKKLGLLVSAILLTGGVSAVLAATTPVTTTTTSTTAPAASAAPMVAQPKVAVVNVQQVLQQSPRVAELSKKLESQFKPRQTKINDEQKALQDAVDKFKKESPTMSQKDRASTEKKISDNRADLVKQVVGYQQDLQKEQNKVMQGILNDLNSIVSAIAKAQSYTLVFDSQAIIYAADGNDITKDVAKQFNSK